jgi:hypothetical protein
MNDAHAYEMQVQMWKPNTWGVIDHESCLHVVLLLHKFCLEFFKRRIFLVG